MFSQNCWKMCRKRIRLKILSGSVMVELPPEVISFRGNPQCDAWVTTRGDAWITTRGNSHNFLFGESPCSMLISISHFVWYSNFDYVLKPKSVTLLDEQTRVNRPTTLPGCGQIMVISTARCSSWTRLLSRIQPIQSNPIQSIQSIPYTYSFLAPLGALGGLDF